MNMNKKGQMYTLEALLASLIIFGVVIFAINASPQFGTETKEFTKLQLKKYADDILEILDLEKSTQNLAHKSLLSMWIENNNVTGFKNCFSRISKYLRRYLSIMLRVEVLYPNGTIKPGFVYGPPPPEGAVSSFRVVPVSVPPYAYEVRLYLWYV